MEQFFQKGSKKVVAPAPTKDQEMKDETKPRYTPWVEK